MNKYAQHYIHHYNYTLQKLALDPVKSIAPVVNPPSTVPQVAAPANSFWSNRPEPKRPDVLAKEQADRNATAKTEVADLRANVQRKWDAEKALALKEGRQPNYSVLD